MTPSGKSRRNHTVQAALLRRFADERGYLTRVPLEGKPHRINVKDATVINDFYTEREEDGSIDDSFERRLAQLESPLEPALRKLIDESCWPLPPEIRSYLAEWIILQHLRTPFIRSFSDNIRGDVFRASLKLYNAGDFGRYLAGRGLHFEPDEVRCLFEIYSDTRVGDIGSLAEHIGIMNQFGPA